MLKFSKTAKRLIVFMLVLAMICPVLAYTNVTTVDAATATVSSVKVTNLPANKLTLAKGKSKVLRVAVTTTASSVSKAYTFKSSNTKVATVTSVSGGVNVKAIANGTATITVTSKVNTAKRAVIYLTVGTPVTSVKLNKTSATMQVGMSMILKATVAPTKPSNSKIVWTSTNKSVATVTSAGKVVAKKLGTTTIRAVAQDGSGHVATCNVTVANVNSITAIKILNNYTIKVALKYKQKIPQANWVVKTKVDLGSTYRTKSPIEYVQNVNDKVYYINLKHGMDEYTYAQVLVKGLVGTSGYKSKEARLDFDGKRIYEGTKYVYLKKGANQKQYLMSSENTTISISGLPKGVKVVNDYENQAFYLTGTPTQKGSYNAKMTVGYADEKGGYTSDLVIMVSDTESLVAESVKMYGIACDKKAYSKSNSVKVIGGSGEYIFEMLDKYKGMMVNKDSGSYSVEIFKPGTYTYRVKITDANNSKLTTVAKYTFVIEAAKEVEIVLKDASGNIVTDTDAVITIFNRKVDTKYTSQLYAYGADERTGSRRVYLSKGVYDIKVTMGNTYRISVGKNINKETTKVQVTVPAYLVELTTGDEELDEKIEDMYWYDSNGSTVFRGETFFAKKGTYNLVGYDLSYIYSLKINVNKAGEYKVTRTENIFTEDTTQLALLGSGNTRRFKFVPKTTGTYVIETTGPYDTYATLYDSNLTTLVSSDDTGKDYNFSISRQLTAGQTYYLDVKLYLSSSSAERNYLFTDVNFSVAKK